MSHSTPSRKLLTIAIAVGLVAIACPYALAQEEGEEPQDSVKALKIGIVHFDRLSEQYQQLAEKRTEVREWSNSRTALLEELQNYVFLSEENFSEIIDLLKVAPANRSDAQKKRLQDLLELSEQKERKFLDLRSKTERTTEEDDEFNTLRETVETRTEDIQRLAQQMEQDFQTRWGDIEQQLMENVQKVITQVGENNGYDLLLNSSVVFFSSDNVADVTDEIISALNAAESGEEENGGED